jgi:O-antigen ligase
MIAVPYYAYLGLERRSKSIVFYLSVVLVAVLLSQSRSTWAATGVAAFVVVAGYWSKSSRKSRRYATIAAVSLAVAVVPFLARVLIAVRPDTLASRIEQYQEGLEIVLSFPLFGVGFGNIEQFYSEPGNIHSAFLDVTAAAGILAFLLILIIWSVTVLFLIRGIYPSQTKLALAVGLIASLGAMLIESNLQPGFTKAPWITLALALSVYSTSTLRKGISQRDEHI